MNKNKASGLELACTDLYGIHLIKYDLENENRSPYETRVTVSVDFTAVTGILVSKTENRHGFRADQFDTSTSLPLPRPPGITFEGWIVQIPSPRGKKAVQMPH